MVRFCAVTKWLSEVRQLVPRSSREITRLRRVTTHSTAATRRAASTSRFTFRILMSRTDKERPNAESRPGGDIMIHGLPNGFGWLGAAHRARDWTDGCVAVTNAEMDEIWELVPDGTAIDIRP